MLITLNKIVISFGVSAFRFCLLRTFFVNKYVSALVLRSYLYPIEVWEIRPVDTPLLSVAGSLCWCACVSAGAFHLTHNLVITRH